VQSTKRFKKDKIQMNIKRGLLSMGMIQEDTNIYEELQDIKNLLRQVLDILQEVHGLEEDIKIFEGKQTQEEQQIAEAVKRKKFQTIFEWKNAIWDRCPNRKEHITSDTVSFNCTLINGPCMFERCPRNIVEDDPYKTRMLP
jgi:hypothetical protein